jgi:hypothetical protein
MPDVREVRERGSILTTRGTCAVRESGPGVPMTCLRPPFGFQDCDQHPICFSDSQQ